MYHRNRITNRRRAEAFKQCLTIVLKLGGRIREYSKNGQKTNTYRMLVGKPEGNRPLGRPKCMWADVKIYLRERECGDMVWTDLV
jgi:hypothetical protein